ncbi:MAG: hypothetical protein ACI965_001308, partial [Paraglaciecola sp.]
MRLKTNLSMLAAAISAQFFLASSGAIAQEQ